MSYVCVPHRVASQHLQLPHEIDILATIGWMNQPNSRMLIESYKILWTCLAHMTSQHMPLPHEMDVLATGTEWMHERTTIFLHVYKVVYDELSMCLPHTDNQHGLKLPHEMTFYLDGMNEPTKFMHLIRVVDQLRETGAIWQLRCGLIWQ